MAGCGVATGGIGVAAYEVGMCVWGGGVLGPGIGLSSLSTAVIACAAIPATVILTAISIHNSAKEQAISYKKKMECYSEMEKLEHEFKNLARSSEGQEIVKRSNEEEFITLSFNNCIA